MYSDYFLLGFILFAIILPTIIIFIQSSKYSYITTYQILFQKILTILVIIAMGYMLTVCYVDGVQNANSNNIIADYYYRSINAIYSSIPFLSQLLIILSSMWLIIAIGTLPYSILIMNYKNSKVVDFDTNLSLQIHNLIYYYPYVILSSLLYFQYFWLISMKFPQLLDDENNASENNFLNHIESIDLKNSYGFYFPLKQNNEQDDDDEGNGEYSEKNRTKTTKLKKKSRTTNKSDDIMSDTDDFSDD